MTADPPAGPARAPLRHLVIMGLFGFLSGLPLPLSSFTLQQWFTSSHIAPAWVGMTTSLGLAYVLKFLWAPLFDQLPPGHLGRLGRRRGWLLIVQPCLALAVLALANSTPATHAVLTAIAAAGIAFCSASQDILIDSWRIEAIEDRFQGTALACYTWGYRGAMMVSSSAVIWLAAIWGWRWPLTSLAVMLALGPLITWAAPAPPKHTSHQASFHAAIIAPLKDFLGRPGAGLLLSFVILFLFGKVCADTMAASFYHDGIGMPQRLVGIANFWPGLLGTLIGAALGGIAVRQWGARLALMVTGLLQAASLGLYLMLLATGPSLIALSVKIGLEMLAANAASVAFLSFISALCVREYTATQYALLSALAAVAFHTMGGVSGLVAQTIGWTWFYTLTIILSLPALGILWTLPSIENKSGMHKMNELSQR